MTDQELDTLMRRVLLDSLKLDAESAASGELAFEPTPRYQRQMAAMVKDPLKWERRRARPLWKNVAQKAAVILLVFSFNEAKSLSVFSGFSLKWYQELFRDGETLNALKNTLILAVIASVVSTAMGTAAAVGMNKLRSKYLRAALDTATDIPMMNPDIITGI